MNETVSTDLRVALVAADAVGIAALRPAGETLDAFAVAWEEHVVPAGGAGTLDAARLRAMIVASADAALPAALASATRLPVIRVPAPAGERSGIALLRDPATENLPSGDAPFATVAIGEAGAKNAALFVVATLGLTDARLWAEWLAFRRRQTDTVLGLAPLTDA